MDRFERALGDRYAIQGEVGAGGMATVYLADDKGHGCQVVLKVLRPEMAAMIGPHRFLQEIKTRASQHHPHFLPHPNHTPAHFLSRLKCSTGPRFAYPLVTYAGMAAVLLTVAALAGWVPAVRAARIRGTKALEAL